METFALSHVAGKALDHFVSKMKDGVIERWGRHRAQRFVESFVSEVAKELQEGERSEDLDELLTQFVEDEKASAALFDAYRRVVISASKDIGPCVIGMLKAQLLLEEREPTWEEERMFTVAQELSDKQLIDFCTVVRDNFSEKENDSEIRIQLKTETIEDRGVRQEKIDFSTPNLGAHFGSWGIQLRRLGVLKENVVEEEKSYYVGDDHYKCKEKTWAVFIPLAYVRFAEIIERVHAS